MRQYGCVLCLGLMLLWGTTGCALKHGEASALSERGYRVSLHISDNPIWLRVPPPLSLPQTAEVVVRVRDAQAQPVDGMTVTFGVEPSWTQYVSLTTTEAPTRHGEARTIFQASTTGVVPIMARVDNVTLRATITVVGRPNVGDGGS